MLRRPAAIVVLALTALSSRASAAPLPHDVERSVTLYEQGRKLVDGGDCAKAIPLFEESNRYNESIGAHLSIAECRTNDPLAAWREFKRAESLARRKEDDRARYAHDHAAALHPRLALLDISLPPSARPLVDAKEISEDVNALVAVEPGKHLVEIVRADGTRVSKNVEVSVGAIVHVTAEPDVPAPSGLLPPGPAEGRTRRSVGAILMGGSAPLAIVGGIFAIVAVSKLDDAKSSCPAYPSCASEDTAAAARDANDSGRRAALVSTIGVGVGLAAIAIGAVLFLTAPRRATATGPLTIRF